VKEAWQKREGEVMVARMNKDKAKVV